MTRKLAGSSHWWQTSWIQSHAAASDVDYEMYRSWSFKAAI